MKARRTFAAAVVMVARVMRKRWHEAAARKAQARALMAMDDATECLAEARRHLEVAGALADALSGVPPDPS